MPRKVVEAALFISPRPLSLSELAEIARTDVETVEQIVEELSKEFGEGRGIVLERVGNAVRLYVPDDVFPLVRHLSPVPEFDGQELRVVAYIAREGAVLRSTLRKLFGRAADRAVEKLKGMGAVVVRRKGRTYEIRKTKVFDDYFVAP